VAEALIVAVVGAESTGKTALAQALAERLGATSGRRCTWVPETLRAWCDAHGRTPRQDEQRGIAAEQTARIREAARHHELVVADTTALMTAVYSHIVFGDDSLDAEAAAAHRECQLTLLTAIDLPWQADGHQRDGPQVREPVDQRLRGLLQRHGVSYSLALGQGPQRLQSALDALQPWWPHDLLRRASATLGEPATGSTDRAGIRASNAPETRDRHAFVVNDAVTHTASHAVNDAANHDQTAYRRWQQACERCGDPACERASHLRR
jgi:nicotinamide riboside kinase